VWQTTGDVETTQVLDFILA